MAQTLAPTNRKETATAENVDFGTIKLSSTSPFMGRTDIEYLPPFTKEMLENITSMTDYFNGCTALKKVVLPKDNKTITYLIRTFANCTNLERAVLPDNLDKIYSAVQAFRYCGKLQSIIMPNLPFKETGGLNGTFDGCTALKSATIGDIAGEASVNYVFTNCTSLETVILGDWSDVQITGNYKFYRAFNNCKAVKNFSVKKLPMIDFPAHVGFSVMSQLAPQSYANIFAALPCNTGDSELTIYLNATSLNAAKATTGKYTATDVYDTTTKKEQSKSLTINDWITAATNKGWIINS